MKKNMEVTLSSLVKLEPVKQEALSLIESCEKHGVELVSYQGQEMQVQEAVLEQLAAFGGSKQADGMLAELEEKNAKVTRAEKALRNAIEQFHEERGRVTELSAKKVVYESLAHDEKQSLQTLNGNAEMLEKRAGEQAVTAGQASNDGRVVYHGWWWWSYVSVYDNRGDLEQERARKLRQYAQEAKNDVRNQQDKMKAAAETAAVTGSALEKAKLKCDDWEKQIETLAADHQAAKDELRKFEQRLEAHRESFGGISLKDIASLKQHLQELPKLLGAQGMQNGGMFAAMKGALLGHELVIDQMRSFLTCTDDGCVKSALAMLRPTIVQAIADATFFAKEMAPLKQRIETQISALPGPDVAPQSLAQNAAEKAGDAQSRSTPPHPESTVSLQEDDDLW